MIRGGVVGSQKSGRKPVACRVAHRSAMVVKSEHIRACIPIGGHILRATDAPGGNG